MIDTQISHTAEGWRIVAGHPSEIADDLAWFRVDYDKGEADREDWQQLFDAISIDRYDLNAIVDIFDRIRMAMAGAS